MDFYSSQYHSYALRPSSLSGCHVVGVVSIIRPSKMAYAAVLYVGTFPPCQVTQLKTSSLFMMIRCFLSSTLFFRFVIIGSTLGHYSRGLTASAGRRVEMSDGWNANFDTHVIQLTA
jgi:hypothetical protein